MIELRRYQRAALDLPVEFVQKASEQRYQGRSKDVSLGGMFIITDHPLPFGAELTVYIFAPGQKSPVAIPAVVRWSRARDGMGVQFGLMGARETHAITELTKAP